MSPRRTALNAAMAIAMAMGLSLAPNLATAAGGDWPAYKAAFDKCQDARNAADYKRAFADCGVLDAESLKFGAFSRQRGSALATIGTVFGDLGRKAEAAANEDAADKILTRLLDVEDPLASDDTLFRSWLVNRTNRGYAALAMNETDKARTLAQQSVEYAKKKYGAYSPKLAKPMQGLVGVLEEAGDRAGAQSLLADAMQLALAPHVKLVDQLIAADPGTITVSKTENEGLRDVAELMRQYANDYLRGAEQRDMLANSLSIYLHVAPLPHPLSAEGAYFLGKFDFEQRDYQSALPLLQTAVHAFEQHPDVLNRTARTRFELAKVNTVLRDYASAAAQLQLALPAYEKLYAKQPRYLMPVLELRGQVQLGMHDVKGAEATVARLSLIEKSARQKQ
ncbi:tetratricopeptide repeat protein [Quatrionicoccus australiensis]|uniref:tetratricopeptide repeat protein n=1 Tax=Quatrionicoccus australiensis TaxID=138118 RepID=UPI001CF9E767|nr:tetratricopeptide repeat protein [Quatrionicoccus australiensis]MCB4359587.1 tetratricopeptide repeat protein [Quatrionicoccus australiensis]